MLLLQHHGGQWIAGVVGGRGGRLRGQGHRGVGGRGGGGEGGEGAQPGNINTLRTNCPWDGFPRL